MDNILIINLNTQHDFYLEGLPYKPVFVDYDTGIYKFIFDTETIETAVLITKTIMEQICSSDPILEHDIKEMFLLAINDINYCRDINYAHRFVTGKYSGTEIVYCNKVGHCV